MERKNNVFIWIRLNLRKDVEKKVLFSDIYGGYLKSCRTQGTIPCSKKKFSIYVREYFSDELEKETIIIENRGGIKVYGMFLNELV